MHWLELSHKRTCYVAIAVFALARALALLAWPASDVSRSAVLLLDALALVPTVAAYLAGTLLARGFGSIVFSAVVIVLPAAGIGALTEALSGRALSDLSGCICVFAIGVGFSFGALRQTTRFNRILVQILALTALAGATKFAIDNRGAATSGLLLGSPYLVAAAASFLARAAAGRSVGKPT